MQSMSSLPDTRQQSFDEIYGPPENFLEIEVRLFCCWWWWWCRVALCWLDSLAHRTNIMSVGWASSPHLRREGRACRVVIAIVEQD